MLVGNHQAIFLMISICHTSALVQHKSVRSTGALGRFAVKAPVDIGVCIHRYGGAFFAGFRQSLIAVLCAMRSFALLRMTDGL
jgi:hypothetical protein